MEDQKYILGVDSINGIKLNEKIKDEELHEFYIEDREDFIDRLCGWISEATKDKQLMIDDLKILLTWTDEYIFSSNSTNDYVSSKCERFNEICEELLELNKNFK